MKKTVDIPLLCSVQVAALVILIPHCLSAIDDSYSEVLKYMSPRTSTGIGHLGSMKWVIGIVVAGIMLLTLISRLSGRKNRRPPHSPPTSASHPKSQRTFLYQAMTLGLKLKEGRNLRKIAAHLSPRQPESLLTTPSGREFLIADIKKRVHQRQREIEVLQQLQGKLERMNSATLRARETLRVETDLPIWITRKVQYHGSLPEGEEVFPESQPVYGQLIDLSEGGAALSADLEIGEGDLVEIWSADPDVWISTMTAGVVRVEDGNGNTPPVLHLHFLDPPGSDLKAALRKLQEDGSEVLPAS